MGHKTPKDPKNRQGKHARKNQYDRSIELALDDLSYGKKFNGKTETVDDFLKRGGSIKKYAYKWPPVWKKTFNGFSKYDKR